MTGNKIPLYFLLVFFFTLSSAAAELVDRSVAIVNDDIITLSEVNEMGQPLFKKAAAEVPPDQLEQVIQQIRSEVIGKLVDQKLLFQKAAQLNISVSDQEVDNAIQRILSRNKITKKQFVQELADIGMTEALYRSDLMGQILQSKLVNYEVRSKVIITEEQIIDHYDMNYTDQVGEGGYYILQLGVGWGNIDAQGNIITQEQAKKRIAALHQKAKNGEPFKELAKQYSTLPSAVDGGDLGVFQAEEMASFMRKAIVGLRPGEISEIVAAPDSYQFFTVLSSQEGQIITKVPYESVKEEIREKLYQEKMKALYEEWIKSIREQAYIKIL
ncbi:MAG: hypothetical protein CSB34_05035 [Desulfobulbus propionicus]|nr:MAG: hypothetical protein CSB34_05035 [Desulfobulbus propionicus]